MIYTTSSHFQIGQVYNIIDSNMIRKYYPDADKWFVEKILSNLHKNRDIISIIENDKIMGFVILKMSENKKMFTSNKICTLYIDEEYRNRNIGSLLLTHCFNKYEGKFHITVNENRLNILYPLLSKFNFKESQVLENIYIAGMKEHVYEKEK